MSKIDSAVDALHNIQRRCKQRVRDCVAEGDHKEALRAQHILEGIKWSIRTIENVKERNVEVIDLAKLE